MLLDRQDTSTYNSILSSVSASPSAAIFLFLLRVLIAVDDSPGSDFRALFPATGGMLDVFRSWMVSLGVNCRNFNCVRWVVESWSSGCGLWFCTGGRDIESQEECRTVSRGRSFPLLLSGELPPDTKGTASSATWSTQRWIDAVLEEFSILQGIMKETEMKEKGESRETPEFVTM